MVARLLAESPFGVPADLVDKAHVLDGFCIPTRCANGHAEGPPFEHFGSLQNEELRCAGEITELGGRHMAGA